MAQTSQAKAQTMRAVALDKFGGPEALKIQDLPIPAIEAQEVLIRVEAAGVGAWDPFEREGRFVEIMGVEPEFPYVLGTDGAGTIAAVGKDVSRFKEGDRVYAAQLANPKGGFYAQYAAIKSDNVSLIPGHMSVEQAAVLPTDALTALTGLEKVLGLKSGESLLVYGANGGIGHLALQLAKRIGANVLAIRKGGRIAYPHGVMPEPTAPEGVEIEAYDGETSRELIDRLNALIDSGPFDVQVDRVLSLEE